MITKIIFDIIDAIINIAIFGGFVGLSIEMFVDKKYTMGGFMLGFAVYELVRIIDSAWFFGR